MTGLLIKDALIIPMDGVKRAVPWINGDVFIADGVIREIGANLTVKDEGCEIIHGKDTVVLPGLVNCHTHAGMTLLRSYADDLPLMKWLSEKIWPREAHLTAQDIYRGTMLSILEMIKSGTTCFADMYFFMDEVARAVEETGIRAVLSRGMVGTGDKAQFALDESREFVKKWHKQADGRITCMLGPHASYTCPPEYLYKVMQLSDELGVGLHIHLAETAGEVEDMEKKYGKTPIKLMEAIGIFKNRQVLAAHCVHVSDEEIEILKKYNVGIAHNPQSNMKLASGAAPVPKMLKAGALVGLGTDSAASNNNLDLLEEMRTCALLHKLVSLDSTVLPAYQVLEMATRQGSKVLGLEKTGSIQPGYKADLIMMDLHKPHLIPLHDPVANVVYAAQSSDIKTVIVDGKIVMKDRKILTFDEEKILFEAQECARDLVGRE